MKIILVFGVLILTVVLLVGCAAGPNEFVGSPNPQGQVAGFWQGLWHGIIAPITFIISLFSDSVEVFEVHNNGNWYVFGFLLGLAIVWGGGGRGSAGRRHR
jgi:uncharacterized spore protein YtfJ